MKSGINAYSVSSSLRPTVNLICTVVPHQFTSHRRLHSLNYLIFPASSISPLSLALSYQHLDIFKYLFDCKHATQTCSMRISSLFIFFFITISQCLIYSKYSINMNWIKEWKNHKLIIWGPECFSYWPVSCQCFTDQHLHLFSFPTHFSFLSKLISTSSIHLSGCYQLS